MRVKQLSQRFFDRRAQGIPDRYGRDVGAVVRSMENNGRQQSPSVRSFDEVPRQGSHDKEETRMRLFLVVLQLAQRFSKYYAPVFKADKRSNDGVDSSLDLLQICNEEQMLRTLLGSYPGQDILKILDLAEQWASAVLHTGVQTVRVIAEKFLGSQEQAADD